MTIGVLRERPTVSRPVPGAAGSVRASAPAQVDASAATEDRRPLHEIEEAWKADAGRVRLFGELVSEPCLCGGVITARATEPLIAAAVRAHNQSTAHEQWAIKNGWR